MADSDVIAIYQFLKILQIDIDGYTTKGAEHDKDSSHLLLTKRDENGMAHANQSIDVVIHKDSNTMDIKKHVVVKYDFQPMKDKENQYTYRVVDEQTLCQIEAKDEKIDFHYALVHQSRAEDTLGFQSGIIVDFNSVYDTMAIDKIRIIQANQNSIDTNNMSYNVPVGYKITDGIAPITVPESRKAK